MNTSERIDGLLLFVLGAIVASVVVRHIERSHVAMDQRIYDREFKTIVENYV